MMRLRVLTSVPIKTVWRWPGIPGYFNGKAWILESEIHPIIKPVKRKIINANTRKVIEGDIKRHVAMGLKLCDQRLTPEVEKEIIKVYEKTLMLVKKLKGYNAS